MNTAKRLAMRVLQTVLVALVLLLIMMITVISCSTDKPKPSVPAGAISTEDARSRCQEALRDRLNHRSTGDFDLFSENIERRGLRTTYANSLSAKNSFGLELRARGACVFDGTQLVDVYLGEER